MRLTAATVVLALMLSDLAEAAWHPPVPGTVTRPFDLGSDPFEAGRHRGIDLSASPGTTVRAACAGPVAFAGTAGSSGRVVTVLCGPWRVTHMPLASIAVRSGAAVREGAPLGTLAASREHGGLHLGVRRDGTRFEYTDPLRFLAPGRPSTAPPLGPAPRPPGRHAPHHHDHPSHARPRHDRTPSQHRPSSSRRRARSSRRRSRRPPSRARPPARIRRSRRGRRGPDWLWCSPARVFVSALGHEAPGRAWRRPVRRPGDGRSAERRR